MTPSYSPLYQSLFNLPLKSAKQCIILSAICIGMPAIAAEIDVNANTAETNTNIPRTTLPKITVTATRVPTAISNTIAQTRIIDGKTLERYKGQTVLEVLKHQPGVSYYQSGGMGTKSSFYLRGYDSQSVLVLINGIRFNKATTGRASVEALPADQIERIEILYGASGSSIYGADAVGGVIQIFTKDYTNAQNQLSVTAGLGSNDHYLYGASAQLNNGAGSSLRLSASHNETDGIDAIVTGADAYSDDDGFAADNISLAAEHRFNDAFAVGLNGLYSESDVEYDSGDTFKDARQEQKEYAVSTFVDFDMNGINSRLQYGESKDKRVNFDKNSPEGNLFEAKQQQTNLQLTYPMQTGTIVGGLEWLQQEGETSKYAASHERDIKSVFAGYQLNNDAFNLQTNVRYDDNSEFGSVTTYHLGGAYHVSPSLRMGAAYSTGFRAPSLDTMYDSFSGNPDLQPEESDNYEVFVEANTLSNQTRVTGYYSDVDDLIDYDSSNNYKMGNIDKARIQGITLTSDWDTDYYIYGLSYDYQDAENRSGKYKGQQIKFRPKQKGLIYAGYQDAEFDIRAEVQHIGKRYALDGSGGDDLGTKMDKYNLVNLSANYYMSPSLTLNTRINNLLNKEYTTIDTYDTRYNQDGINFLTSLTYNFD